MESNFSFAQNYTMLEVSSNDMKEADYKSFSHNYFCLRNYFIDKYLILQELISILMKFVCKVKEIITDKLKSLLMNRTIIKLYNRK